jgi:hypothetical protein
MKTILIILSLVMVGPATAADLMSPGSPFNPYVIRQTAPGQAEITTEFPDLSRSPMAPGQPFNPYKIQNQGNGTTTMQTEYPDSFEAYHAD